MWTKENISTGLEAFSMALLTRILRWTKEEVDAFLTDVKQEIEDRNVHAYIPM